MSALWVALGVIFLAELGDKSQLLALALAARYKAVPVIIGLTIATAAMHALSVLIGVVLGASIPTRAVTLISGVAFVLFGLWTLRGDELDDEEAEPTGRLAGRSPVVVACALFAMAEFGDKTMLATITLAASGGWFWVWLGSTVGMVAADLLAVLVGAVLGARLPERPIRIGAAIIFVLCGLFLIVEGIRS